MTRTTSLAAQDDCPSCHGLNISCPDGCGRDPVTGELDGSTLKLAAQDGLVEALLRDCHQYIGAMTTQNKRGEILYRRLSADLSAIKEQHHD